MPRNVNPVPQYSDAAGDPLVSGKMYYFDSGTDTPKVTYADINLAIPNTHPVILTGDGRLPNVFFNGVARQKLTDSDDVQIWDKDPVGDQNTGGDFEAWVPQVVYNQNDIVEGSDGNFYISFTNGNENNDPVTSPEFWQEIEFINVWNPNVTYDLGDTVKASNNNFFKSLIADNLGNDPVSSPVEWGAPIDVDLASPGPIGETVPDTIQGTTLDLAAIAGILEENPEFIDAVIFGPARDPVDWSGMTEAPTARVMIATLETVLPSSCELKIWDFTGGTLTGLTPLFAVVEGIIGTAIAASMGYVILGASNSGVRFYDPHDGLWRERVNGWPNKTQSPILASDDVADVCAMVWKGSRYDPLTGGPLPSFGLSYGSGTDVVGVIKDDGNVFSKAGTIGHPHCAMSRGVLWFGKPTGVATTLDLARITGDDFGDVNNPLQVASSSYGLGPDNGLSVRDLDFVTASLEGLTIAQAFIAPASAQTGEVRNLTSIVTREFTTGFMFSDIRGVLLANSRTIDRSYKLNTLTAIGTPVTESAVEVGAELLAYGGGATPFSAADNLIGPTDTDYDFGTGDFTLITWFRSTGVVSDEFYIYRRNTGGTGPRFDLEMNSNGTIRFHVNDGSQASSLDTPQRYDNDAWHMAVAVYHGATGLLEILIDGAVAASVVNAAIGNMDMTVAPLGIGVSGQDGVSNPAVSSRLALIRLSVQAPSAAQVRKMYDAERPMFAVDAKCLLQSGTTDEVLDADIDPITGDVAVTQIDHRHKFRGFAVIEDSDTPAIGGTTFKRRKIYGERIVEINDANLYAEMGEESLREISALVEGLKTEADLQNLGEAKASILFTNTIGITASFGIKMLIEQDTATHDIVFAVPFKNNQYTVGFSADFTSPIAGVYNRLADRHRVQTYNNGGGNTASVGISFIYFGEPDE